VRFVELFAGIGGFSLGFERAGMECVGHVEIDPYAQKVLLKHWPKVKLMEDVKNVKGTEFGQIDLLCGGFPCQDLSVGGKQKGITGERSGLFDEIIRIARVCKPRFIVLENVANLLARPDWFGYVLGRLAQIGYDAEWEIIRAWQVGLPHSRARIFIVAYSNECRLQTILEKYGNIRQILSKAPNLSNSYPYDQQITGLGSYRGIRESDGVPNRTHRIRCLGNALLPQIAEYIGNCIMEAK